MKQGKVLIHLPSRQEHDYFKYADVGIYNVRHAIANHHGAGHPVCFTDEVMAHKFLPSFKLENIEQYDGSMDPSVWTEDYIIII